MHLRRKTPSPYFGLLLSEKNFGQFPMPVLVAER
jgi:hypothetical protein